MHSLGLIEKLREAGMVTKESDYFLRWQDGRVIGQRPGKEWSREKFGFESW